MKLTLRALRHPVKSLRLRHVPWLWCLCVAILTVLGLFLTGNKLFGMSDELSAVLALLGLLMAPLLTLIIFPFIAFLLTLLAAFAAGLAFFLAPVIGALTAAWGWLLASALGQAIIAPVYNLLAPLLLKVAPFLTTGKFAGKAWSTLQKRQKARALKKTTPIKKGKKTSSPRKPKTSKN